jgi:hypothetical protein
MGNANRRRIARAFGEGTIDYPSQFLHLLYTLTAYFYAFFISM